MLPIARRALLSGWRGQIKLWVSLQCESCQAAIIHTACKMPELHDASIHIAHRAISRPEKYIQHTILPVAHYLLCVCGVQEAQSGWIAPVASALCCGGR